MNLSIGIELLPEWAPSLNPAHARFDVLVKASYDLPAVDVALVRIELRDSAGDLIDTIAPQLDKNAPPLTGPGWRVITGRHVLLADRVTHAEALLGTVRSTRTGRAESKRPLTLVPIRDVIGIPHEPHLWWRFLNTTGKTIDMPELIASTKLWIGGALIRPITTYNGPSTLPPGRAISGLWSLDDLRINTQGPQVAQLTILDERTEPVTTRPIERESDP